MTIREVQFTNPEPKQEIVRFLKVLLEEAKKGEIQRIVVAASGPDGNVQSLWRFGGSFTETAGLSAILHNAIMTDAIMDCLEDATGLTYR